MHICAGQEAKGDAQQLKGDAKNEISATRRCGECPDCFQCIDLTLNSASADAL